MFIFLHRGVLKHEFCLDKRNCNTISTRENFTKMNLLPHILLVQLFPTFGGAANQILCTIITLLIVNKSIKYEISFTCLQ